MLLLLCIPIFTYLISNQVWIFEEPNADSWQVISGVLFSVLTSIFALHKLITSWVDTRQYRAHFTEAKIKLKDILYIIESEFNNGGGLTSNNTLTYDLMTTLKSATKKSRKIVDNETLTYFKLQKSPAFDLSGAFREGAKSASSLLSSLEPYSRKQDDSPSNETNNENLTIKKVMIFKN